MQKPLISAGLMLLVWTVITGVAYPLAVTGLAKLLFPVQANGSLITGNQGEPLGSALIGQAFSDPKYFWGRPSATSPYPYNAGASSGSNLGPTNPALMESVNARIEALQMADPDNRLPIPVDLITSSASGLDPHISLAAAFYQTNRVAKTRKMPIHTLHALINANTEPRQWFILGEPRVNVLRLNMALDGKTR